MAHYGRLRDFDFSEESADDVRGATVYGINDEKLGKIDDVIFDHSTASIQYVVIDTGGWLTSKKFVVPPQQLRPSAKHEDDFSVDLSKKQIESFPEYKEEDVESEEKWRDYGKRFQSAWTNGVIQHRKGTDHNITPTPDEMPEQPGSIGSQISVEENRRLSQRIIPPTADEVTIDNGAIGMGDWWLTFESRLRQRRRDITAGCENCGVGPVSDSEESAADERKAV